MTNLVTEDREVSDFRRVRLGGFGSLTITPGDQEALQVETDAKLLPRITTEVREGTLVLKVNSGWLGLRHARDTPVRYRLTVKELEGIQVSGAGKVQASNLVAEHFDLGISGAGKAQLELATQALATQISGSGKIVISGKADRQVVNISGAGRYAADELSSQQCSFTISGAGKGRVNVSEQLDVTISGAGKVEHRGDPVVRTRLSGVGKVTRIESQ